jgi:hypothetical protein
MEPKEGGALLFLHHSLRWNKSEQRGIDGEL